MKDHQSEIYNSISERYALGDVPWDDPLPPPEVLSFVPTIEAGRALDLGCGYGRASIYLASRGWEVDAVDFISQAVDVARERARSAGVTVRFHVSPVTDLSFLKGRYDFALDVGCAHALDDDGLSRYRDQLYRLLSPGGYFMLFARVRAEDDDETNTPRGLDESTLLSVFGDGFELTWSEHSESYIEDGPSWPSAWYRFRRRPGDKGQVESG